MLHIRNLEGDSIQDECTACPSSGVSFEVRKKHISERVIAELVWQFEDHRKIVHQGESVSQTA